MEKSLKKFEFLPEHADLYTGFFVRIKGSVYHVQWRDPVTRKMKSKRGGTTYTEVIDTIRQIATRTTIGKPVVSGLVPTWQVIEDWFEREVIPKRKPKTAESYAYYVERFILPALGEVRFCDLSAPVLEEFFERIDEFDTADPARKRHEGVSVDQVNATKKIVKALFGWAHKEGYVLGNPAAPLRQEAVEPKEQPIYTPEQFEFLLSFAHEYYRPHLVVLYWSSMRVGELGALPWRNIALRDDGRVDIRIEQALSARQISAPKTPRSRRTITLPVFIADLLREHQIRQLEMHDPHPDGLVFTTSTGRTLDTGRFRERVLYRARDRANKELARLELPLLPKVTVHGLRHSTITVYTDHGSTLPEAAVQRHAGHTNSRMTERYTHLEHKRREALADVIEEVHGRERADRICEHEETA